MQQLELQVWSDIACPWCFVGKRRLETALSQLGDGDQVAVRYRAFELDPAAPPRYPEQPSYLARLASKYGLSEKRAAETVERMRIVGETEGIVFDFASIKAGNTFDAHRLLCSVSELGLQASLKERLLIAYFSEGQRLSDKDTLLSLASEVGVDTDHASSVLFSQTFHEEVRAEQRLAVQLGVHGVPFFGIGKYGVSGAQPPELLLQVLKRALAECATESERAPQTTRSPDSGSAICTPDHCD
jgi:predicted DsbA family dithiol-disulfide isomerase